MFTVISLSMVCVYLCRDNYNVSCPRTAYNMAASRTSAMTTSSYMTLNSAEGYPHHVQDGQVSLDFCSDEHTYC